MSDLAYNLQGERFLPPANAAMWRVRRFKRSSGRGMPEVVFGDDGLPLTVPIDIDIDEFRRQVGGVPGKYRLDPIDAQQQACEGGQPAYVQFQEGGPSCAGAAPASAPVDGMLREVIAANTEMVRAIADKFAQVMESAAVLLRAADGAGLPAREPAQLPAPPSPVAAEVDDDDEIDPDEHPITAMLKPVIQGALPLLNHTVNTKVLGLTHEQSIALLGGTPPAAAPSSPPAAPSSAPAASTDSRSGTPPTSAPPSRTSGSSPEASRPGDAQRFASHMVAVQALLEPEETALVIAAAKAMTPEALAVWREKLLAMSPADAAAAIRSEIKKGDTSNDQ